jgi:hypothetical protein
MEKTGTQNKGKIRRLQEVEMQSVLHGVLKHDTKENSERKRCGRGNI